MRNSHLSILIALVAFTGCSPDAPDSRPEVARWDGEPLVAGPWLRDQLPEGILAYHRIPHPLGLMTAPKGNVLDAALASDANVRNVLRIQQGLSDNILTALPMFEDVRLRLLLEELRSPIEIAAFGPPQPSALTAMTLGIDTAAEFEALLSELSGVSPAVSLVAPLDERGFGQLDGLPGSTFLRFDTATGRFVMQTGAHVTAESFAELANQLKPGTAHRMHGLEELIDESGQGWFAWLDTETTLPMAQLLIPIGITEQIRELGLDSMRSIAFGAGVAGRKGRISFLLDIGNDRANRFFPLVDNIITATSVGEPDGIVLVSIPTAEEFTRIESLVMEKLSRDEAKEWTEAKAAFFEATGVSIEELFSSLGPECLFILDAAGDYVALRLRDADLFDDILRRLAEKADSAPLTHEAHGTTFYHWKLPSIYSAMDSEATADTSGFAALLQRQREHWHWIREGDFLYAASIPQPLMDRVRAGADTDVSTWLAESQKVDVSSAVFAATGSVDKVPRRVYHLYVEMLQYVADFGLVDYDVWGMPTAGELGLPDEGALGFTMNLGEPYLSIELSFESNPGEFFVGAGFGTVAVAGILAAIAIPAYQDYTVRARIAGGLSQAARTKASVAEHFLTTGQFPGEAEALMLNRYDTGEHVESIIVHPGTGVIVIQYTDVAVPGGGRLDLQPMPGEDGTIVWSCSGTVQHQYLPAACRDTPDDY